jgi:hypothetical protein
MSVWSRRFWSERRAASGRSARPATAGLHARYLRAVAVSEETVWVTVSTGPRGKRAAIYRRPLAGDAPFERCRRGLPEWFEGNIDTACLAASGQQVAFGTEDGRLFHSLDGGGSWAFLAQGLPAVRCVTLRPEPTARVTPAARALRAT